MRGTHQAIEHERGAKPPAGGAFHVPFDPSDLTRKVEPGLGQRLQRRVEHFGRVEKRVAMHRSVALEFGELQLRERSSINVADLDIAMQKLEMLTPLAKQKLLQACAVSVMNDQKISAVETELLRAIANMLGCPMPPIIHEQVY